MLYCNITGLGKHYFYPYDAYLQPQYITVTNDLYVKSINCASREIPIFRVLKLYLKIIVFLITLKTTAIFQNHDWWCITIS